VPPVWKQANVVAVPKIKPPKTVEQDLRPISLTPTISKIFESLVGRWILGTISSKFDSLTKSSLGLSKDDQRAMH